MILGISAALAAAFCWALSAVWFKHLTHSFSFSALNFHKGWLSIIGLSVACLFVAEPLTGLSTGSVLLLLLSGVIGIGIGDTALFASLHKLSERQTLLIAESAAPLLVIFGGLFLLSEFLNAYQVIAIVLIVASVDLVVGLRSKNKQNIKTPWQGIALALVAALCQAIGVLLVRHVFADTEINPLSSALIRILGGVLVLAVWLKFNPKKLAPKHGWNALMIKRLVAASFVGTLLALTLIQFSLGLISGAIAQTLIATSALFAALIAFFSGETLTRNVWLGLLVGWLGVAVMIWGSTGLNGH